MLQVSDLLCRPLMASQKAVRKLLYSPPAFAMTIPTHLTDDEKRALYRQVLKLSPKCVALEVGSYLGASASVIGSAIGRRRGVLHCVDTWQNQAMSEGRRDTWTEFQENTKPVRSFIIPHRGFSTDIAQELFVDLDFLFVDGDHSEKAVDADLSAWLPKVKRGGIVAMHDIGWAEGVILGFEKHLKGRICSEQRLPNLLICKFLG